MKIFSIILLLLMPNLLRSQTDSVVAGVYSFNKATPLKSAGAERKNLLSGSSTDLSNIEIHTLTLSPGTSAPGSEVNSDHEKLILVKEGDLTITVKDSSATLGPGSFVVIIAGDKHGFKNATSKPVTYYSLTYTARVTVNIKRGNDAGGSFMQDWKYLVVKQTERGESRPIFDRPSSMFSRFDMHATALKPGMASHPPHQHRAEEIILMIKGEIQVQIAQNFLRAVEGDVIFYPAYSIHAVKNTGSSQCGYFAIQWRNE